MWAVEGQLTERKAGRPPMLFFEKIRIRPLGNKEIGNAAICYCYRLTDRLMVRRCAHFEFLCTALQGTRERADPIPIRLERALINKKICYLYSRSAPSGTVLSNEPSGRVLRREIRDHRSRGFSITSQKSRGTW